MAKGEDSAIGQGLFEQFLAIWIGPEIERRQAIGELARPLILRAAQVVFYSDERDREIRVNDEVQATARIRPQVNRPISKGDPVYLEDIAAVESLLLHEEEDPNAGHITAIRFGDTWHLTFDASYNKAAIREHVAAATEFVGAAAFCREKGWLHAAVDTLYSAAELAAKAVLLSHQGVERRTSHRAIHSRLNRFASLGNLAPPHLSSFNQLQGARKRFRYLDGNGVIADAELGQEYT